MRKKGKLEFSEPTQGEEKTIRRPTHDKETRRNGAHPSQICHSSRSSENQHRRNDEVGGESEEEEDRVGEGSLPSAADDLAPRGRIRVSFGRSEWC